jgi:hypothetical protein
MNMQLIGRTQGSPLLFWGIKKPASGNNLAGF